MCDLFDKTILGDAGFLIEDLYFDETFPVNVLNNEEILELPSQYLTAFFSGNYDQVDQVLDKVAHTVLFDSFDDNDLFWRKSLLSFFELATLLTYDLSDEYYYFKNLSKHIDFAKTDLESMFFDFSDDLVDYYVTSPRIDLEAPSGLIYLYGVLTLDKAVEHFNELDLDVDIASLFNVDFMLSFLVEMSESLPNTFVRHKISELYQKLIFLSNESEVLFLNVYDSFISSLLKTILSIYNYDMYQFIDDLKQVYKQLFQFTLYRLDQNLFLSDAITAVKTQVLVHLYETVSDFNQSKSADKKGLSYNDLSEFVQLIKLNNDEHTFSYRFLSVCVLGLMQYMSSFPDFSKVYSVTDLMMICSDFIDKIFTTSDFIDATSYDFDVWSSIEEVLPDISIIASSVVEDDDLLDISDYEALAFQYVTPFEYALLVSFYTAYFYELNQERVCDNDGVGVVIESYDGDMSYDVVV